MATASATQQTFQQTFQQTLQQTVQQTTTSVFDLQHQLSAVNSSLQEMRSNLSRGIRSPPSPSSPNTGTAEPELEVKGQQQSQPLSVTQMVTEIHRCLVLGESPTNAVRSSFQSAATEDRAQVVRRTVVRPSNSYLLISNSLPQLRAGSSSTRRI